MNNSENNSDFYKLKYLKYKNKYISLKNKNELELKGGLFPVEGRFLFYIPVKVFNDNKFSLPEIHNSLPEIHKNKKPINLTFQELYDMSVLVIPFAANKVDISSTDEWYIPQKSKELKKWGVKKEHPFKSPGKWLYYIAKYFLDVNPNLKLPELDKLDVYCLEFDINKFKANSFKNNTHCKSFNSFQKEVRDNRPIIVTNEGERDSLLKKISELNKNILNVQTEIDKAKAEYNNAKNASREAEETIETEEKKLKEAENNDTKNQIIKAINKAREKKTKADEKVPIYESEKQNKQINKANIENELSLHNKALGFFDNDFKTLTENKSLFSWFLT